MIGVATHPQEAMLKTTAFEAVFEFPLHVTWQYRVLGRQAVSQTPGLGPGFWVNSLSGWAYMPAKKCRLAVCAVCSFSLGVCKERNAES